MKKALVFAHILCFTGLHSLPGVSTEFLLPSLLAGSWNSGNNWVFSLMEWRELIRTELLVPPEPVTKPFFLLKPPFHTALINLLSKFLSKICYWLNSCSQTAGLQAWKLLLSLSPGLRPLSPSKYKQSCWNNFYASFIPWAVRNSSITPARNYGHECAEDDSQYSPPALLCMRKNVLPFSQQLLQTALAPESPTGVLA